MDWTPDMSVGVAALDEDHKRLFAIFNELHHAMEVGRARQVFADILERLGAYTIEHFAREEALMATTGYPSLDLHRHAHDRARAEVVAMQRRFAEGSDPAVMIDTLAFLQDWLKTHVLETDKRYVAHLHAHGIR